MIYLILSTLLLFTVTAVDESIYYPLIKNMFEKRCIKNASPEVAQDLLDYTKLLSNCIPKEDLVPLRGEFGHERLNYICSAFRAQSQACVQKLGTKIAPCLHAEESFLRDFIVKTSNNTFIRICSEESRDLRRELHANAVKKCMDLQFDIVSSCVKQSGLIDAFTEPDPIVKKYDLCTIIFKITDCIKKDTQEKCKGKGVSDYIASRYDSLTSECNCHDTVHHHEH